MKNCRKLLLGLLLILCFTALCTERSAAAGLIDGFAYRAAETESGAVVRAQSVDGEKWIFLPSSADRTALVFDFPDVSATVKTEFGSEKIRLNHKFCGI